MHDIHGFMSALTVVLCVAAVITVLFQRFRQPVVLGYVLAGLIVGPHVPIPLVADQGTVMTLSELGVILLMFSLGLEFRLQKLVKIGSTAGIIGVIQCSILIWVGFLIGRSFGWTVMESLFLGAIISMSSTTIIAKVFQELNITGPHKEIVVGVLIVEDLIGILFMTLFTGIASGAGLATGPLLLTIGKLTLFLAGVIIIGLFIVPRLMRIIKALDRKETTLVASIGFCFAVALLAQAFGYSVALGAFLAGSLIAEARAEQDVEHLVEPVRDMFAAVFFVSVGMMIDPAMLWTYRTEILLLTAVVIVVKFIGVALGAFLTGTGLRTAIKAGMSMAQIGEFSFIIAGLGLSLRVTGEFLYPITVAISAITTLTTPLLTRASGSVANWADRKLPKPMQTFISLYGSWIEELRASSGRPRSASRVRRYLRLILVDAVLLATITIGTSLGMESMIRFVRSYVDIPERIIMATLIAAAVGIAIPFGLGIFRVSTRLGTYFAHLALPAKEEGRVDFVAAPRRMLVVTLQLGSLLLVGLPLLALTQPFLPGIPVALLVVLILGVLSVVFWRSMSDLQGHVRAGAEVIAEALKVHLPAGGTTADDDDLTELHKLLPGLGDLASVRLTGQSPSIGKTLAEINLRGVTGATALAIIRGNTEVVVPGAEERLRENDVLALSGCHDSVEAARVYLLNGTDVSVPSERSADVRA